jgi:hypothetical protein
MTYAMLFQAVSAKNPGVDFSDADLMKPYVESTLKDLLVREQITQADHDAMLQDYAVYLPK